MSVHAVLRSSARRIGTGIATIGFTVAAIAAAFCLLSPEPPDLANAWLIIGVGIMVIGGVLKVSPTVIRGIADLPKIFRSR